MKYFDEKEKIKKRQAYKHRAEKMTKKESAKMIYERFIEFKGKQNLRSATFVTEYSHFYE
jgi:integrase/recombinase XerD